MLEWYYWVVLGGNCAIYWIITYYNYKNRPRWCDICMLCAHCHAAKYYRGTKAYNEHMSQEHPFELSVQKHMPWWRR